MRLIRTLAYGLRIIGVGLIRRAFAAGGRCGLGPQSDEEMLAWLRSLKPQAPPTFTGGQLLGAFSEENGAVILTPTHYSADGGETWTANPTAEQIQAALDERRKAPPPTAIVFCPGCHQPDGLCTSLCPINGTGEVPF